MIFGRMPSWKRVGTAPAPVTGTRQGAVLAVVLLVAAGPDVSWGATSPEFVDGATRVTAEELIGLVEQHEDLVIIDSRIAGDRRQGYLEGSVSLPDVDTNCDSLAAIVPGVSTPVLFYCNGVKCGRGAKAAQIALACGYRNVYWFRGGFEEWLAKGYPYLKE